MAKDTGEFAEPADTPANEVIRRFLLGSAGSDEQARLEASLFTDEALEERVRTAECELADDYAFQRLSAAERGLFEKNFLVSRDRKRKLEVSIALRQHLAAVAATKESAELSRQVAHARLRERINHWLGLDRPALGFAIALMLLLVFGSIVWLAVKNRRARQQQQLIANQQINGKQRPAVTATPEVNHVVQPSPAEPTHSPKPTAPPAEHAASVLASLLLLPKAGIAGEQRPLMTIPREPLSDRAIIRLELVLDVDEAGSHRAELVTAEGVSVFAADDLKSSNADSIKRVVFEVPARLLRNSDYQVKLNWLAGGSVTTSRRYYFRVAQ